ncbi:MAG: DUF4199 domain-containing protein [Opitutaceae bacterium]|nr:DUF4199 domain-containing protein [Opitutaceae bacterium]
MQDATATTPSAPAPARFALHALTYGGIAGVLGGGLMIGEYALAQSAEHAEIVRWTFIAAMIIPISAVILGMTSWRNRYLGGRIRFVQAFGMALAIGLAFSLVVAGAAWVHATKIHPDLIEKSIDQWAILAAQQPEARPDDIAKQAEEYRQTTTPVVYAQDRFSRSLMLSFFIGLIASITVPKKRPGLE